MLVNLKASREGWARYDRMGGHEYLVAPMVMAVEGVLNGSDGPILYRAEDLSRHVESWNHKPVVVYHPQVNGQAVSACIPEIIDSYKVGVIMRTRFEEGKLKAEAWLEPDRIAEIDPRIGDSVENNEVMELSTGLVADTEWKEGVWNGKPYIGIARNIYPDHLALLPDKVGACSVLDGAGLLRNRESGDTMEQNVAWTTKYINDLPDSAFLYIEPGGKKDEEGKTTPRTLRHLPYKDASGKVDLPHLRNAAARVSQIKGLSAAKLKSLQSKIQALLKRYSPARHTVSGNELSMETVKGGLQSAVCASYGDDAYVVDVFDSTFIFEQGDVLYRMGYTVVDNNIKTNGTPEEVLRQVEYVAVKQGNNVSNRKGEVMNKVEVVEKLLQGPLWEEDDKEFLLDQNEDVLTRLEEKSDKAVVEAEEAARTADAKAEVGESEDTEAKGENASEMKENQAKSEAVLTAPQYIANAPPGIREVLEQGLKTHQAIRDELINRISAHEKVSLSKEQLSDMSLEVLQNFAAVCSDGEEENAVQNFAGLAPVGITNTEEPLGLPTMDIGK